MVNYLSYPIINNFKSVFIRKSIVSLVVFILIQVLFYLLSKFIKFYAGDRKLFGLVFYMMGINAGLWILFISLILSLFPLSFGVKKVPMAVFVLSGYIAFCLFANWGSI